MGEIRLMGFGITPKGWAPCSGQTLSINQNQALYSLLGTTYGGDGQTTFKLPDLRGRAILGMGQGNGLSSYTMGQLDGTESVGLTQAQMPSHSHTFSGTLLAASGPDSNSPNNTYPALPDDSSTPYGTGSANATMAAGMVSGQTAAAGSSQGHENRQPVMAMNYCIALVGIYPTRN